MYITHYHTHRLFHAHAPADTAPGWYFETQGGHAQGPYLNRDDAELALAVYVKTRGRGARAGATRSPSARTARRGPGAARPRHTTAGTRQAH